MSLATIRKRLGHKHIQTTLRYAEQSDAAADAELRTRRRRVLQRKGLTTHRCKRTVSWLIEWNAHFHPVAEAMAPP